MYVVLRCATRGFGTRRFSLVACHFCSPSSPSMFRKGSWCWIYCTYMFRKGSRCFEVSNHMSTCLPNSRNALVCLKNPKCWNRTLRIFLETSMGIIFMNRFYVTYRCGTFWRCLNFGNINKATKLIPECSHQFTCGCHFWLKIFLENFVLPPSLGPRTW